MPDLDFQVQSACAAPLAAVPQFHFGIEIRDREGPPFEQIQSVLLRVQIRIEPTRRSYRGEAGPFLDDLFGDRERWGSTMRSLLWTHVSIIVPPFSETAVIELPVECSFDFSIAATKYFASLEDGDIPLCFLFSGTVFYQADHGLQATQISWQRESNFAVPVRTWKEMMAAYYPNCAWLCLRADAFAALAEYKNRNALPTWEQAVERLLANNGQPANDEQKLSAEA